MRSFAPLFTPTTRTRMRHPQPTHGPMHRVALLLLLLAAPAAAYAQAPPPSAALPASHTDGLFLHARTGGHGIAYEDGIDDADGGGLGLRVGYGFNDRFTLYLGVEGAGLTGSRGFDGLGSDEEYGIAYVELGSRFHFRPGRKLVPYADAAISVIGLGYDGTGGYDGNDVTYGGAGVSLGGGVLYFLSPTLALDGGLAFTPGSLLEQHVGGQTEDVDIKLTGARIHVGLTFYPFR